MRRRDFLVDLTRLAALAATVPNDWRVVALPAFRRRSVLSSASPRAIRRRPARCCGRASRRGHSSRCGGMDGLRRDGAVGGRGRRQASRRSSSKDARPRRRSSATAFTSTSTARSRIAGTSTAFTPATPSSPVGRLRTTPGGRRKTPLSFAFASCQHYEQGYYTAYEHMAREELDLVSHLGDYIYEYGPNTQGVRSTQSAEVVTLDGYRARYAQYKSDPALQAAHALCPWLMIWRRPRGRQQLRGPHRARTTWSPSRVDAQRGAPRRIRRGGSINPCACRAPTRGPISCICAASTGAISRASICSTAGSIAAIKRAATAITMCPAATGTIRSARCSATSRSVG